MSEALRNKIEQAMKTPHIPVNLTSVEAAELDAYLALVQYFETKQQGGSA